MTTLPRIALVATALLAGCSIGPDYTQPSLALPAAYRATQASAAEAWPSRDWWRGFGSPTLDGLIADAIANNFDILAAIGRVEQADAQVRISGSPLLPSVGASGSDTFTRTGSTRSGTTSVTSLAAGAAGAGGSAAAGAGATTASAVVSTASSGSRTRFFETRNYRLGLDVSYEVDLWGRLRAQQQGAEALALFSRFDQQTVALTAVSGVANTWFQALAFQDRLDVLNRNLHDAEEILKAIQARQSVGTASLLDTSQQQALVAGLRAQVPALRSQLEQQLNGLGLLVGRAPEAITARPGTLTTLALPEVTAGLPSELLIRRPDVQAAEAQLVAANADIRAARANFFPTITLTGSGGLESLALSSLFSPGSVLLSAAASAAQTIFDNGLKGGQYDQRIGRYDELVADYRKAIVQAFTDVENALVAYRFATEQEQLEREAVRVAQQAADIAGAQLRAGTSDIVVALQAQNTLFSDLDQLVQARLARFQALVALYKALGGGFARDDVQAPPSTIYHGVL